MRGCLRVKTFVLLAIRRQVWVLCAVLVGAGLAARLGLEGMAWWERLRIQEDQLRARMARLQGWAAVAPAVAAQLEVVFGPGASGSAPLLEGLSRQASAAGVRVTELRPRAGEIELALEGSASALGRYLQQVAAHRPPWRLESLSFASQPRESAPILMRVRLRAIPPSEARP